MTSTGTDKQIAQINEYVRFAAELPTELIAVKVYLGYDASGDPVLDPASMQALFIELRSHADSWQAISTQASQQIRELSITASSVVKDGNGLLRGLGALGPVAQILNKIGKASIGPGDFEATDASLDEDTLDRLNRLQPYVEALKGITLGSLGDTDASNALIADFRTKATALEGKLSGIVTKLKTANVDLIGHEQTIEPTIDAFREACARIVAQFGEGSAAAVAIQQQVEQTLAELTSRKSDLQDRQRLSYAAGRLFVHLQGLGYATLDAQSALTHLWLAGSGACSRLENAVTHIGRVTTEDTLLSFYVSYQQILRDWTTVRDDASTLYRAF